MLPCLFCRVGVVTGTYIFGKIISPFGLHSVCQDWLGSDDLKQSRVEMSRLALTTGPPLKKYAEQQQAQAAEQHQQPAAGGGAPQQQAPKAA